MSSYLEIGERVQWTNIYGEYRAECISAETRADFALVKITEILHGPFEQHLPIRYVLGDILTLCFPCHRIKFAGPILCTRLSFDLYAT